MMVFLVAPQCFSPSYDLLGEGVLNLLGRYGYNPNAAWTLQGLRVVCTSSQSLQCVPSPLERLSPPSSIYIRNRYGAGAHLDILSRGYRHQVLDMSVIILQIDLSAVPVMKCSNCTFTHKY